MIANKIKPTPPPLRIRKDGSSKWGTITIEELKAGAMNPQTFAGRAAAILNQTRKAMRMLVPYKHELLSISEQLGASSPFQCWLEIDRLQKRAAMADALEAEIKALRAKLGSTKP